MKMGTWPQGDGTRIVSVIGMTSSNDVTINYNGHSSKSISHTAGISRYSADHYGARRVGASYYNRQNETSGIQIRFFAQKSVTFIDVPAQIREQDS